MTFIIRYAILVGVLISAMCSAAQAGRDTLGPQSVILAAGQGTTEYLDPQFNVLASADSPNLKYIRTVTLKEDRSFAVRVDYKTGETMMTGRYIDKDLTVEDGNFQYFYANGIVESQGSFRSGAKIGTWKRWNYDGRPKPSRFYPDETNRRTTRTTASAKYPGGMKALQKLVLDSLRYPGEAKDRQIEGTVYVTFVIDQSGDVIQAEVTEGVHYLLDEEALRFVSKMPAWSPATRYGVAVDTNFIMPITFNMKSVSAAAGTAAKNNGAKSTVAKPKGKK
jgi:TonB family protein